MASTETGLRPPGSPGPPGAPGAPGPPGGPYGYTALKMEFDPLLVFLSVMVASVGAFTTLTTVSYLFRVQNRTWYFTMLVQCGLGLGVSTIWALHFIGMRAINLIGVDSADIKFDTGLTLLSAVSPWMFSTFAIHVLKSERSKLRILVAAILLTIGIGSMHYTGVVAERGLFNATIDPGMALIHMPVVVICCILMALVFAHLPTSVVLRCIACFFVACLTATAHYFGMTPVSHRSNPRGWTWQFLPLGQSNVSAEACVIVSLFCDVMLMASNSFYLEVIQVHEKDEMSKELEHRKFVADALPLMKRCQSMQFPLTLVPAKVFLEQGRLVQHETLRDQYLLVMVDSPENAARVCKSRNGGYIVFFSHQWLSRGYPDPTGSQFRDMAYAVEEIARQRRIEINHILIWIDYCSIPQSSPEQQQLAINSLPAYVAACNAFVIVATAETHSDSNELCNFQSYSSRFWCRLEVLCATMTTMNHLDEMQEEQRLYIVAQQRLDSMLVSDEHGVKAEYMDLFHVYQGNTNCCACGHRLPNGLTIACDKHRVATTLVGLYGTMLVQAMRLRESRLKSADQINFLELCEMLIEERQILFPRQFFSSRIEAVHQYLDEVSRCFGRARGSRGQPLRRAAAQTIGASGWRSAVSMSSIPQFPSLQSLPASIGSGIGSGIGSQSPSAWSDRSESVEMVEMMNLEDLSAELCHRAHHRSEAETEKEETSMDRMDRIDAEQWKIVTSQI